MTNKPNHKTLEALLEAAYREQDKFAYAANLYREVMLYHDISPLDGKTEYTRYVALTAGIDRLPGVR